MGPNRHGCLPLTSAGLASVLLPRPAYRPLRWPPARRWSAATRVTAATATTVAVGCLAVAVPCLVFAGVGLWFDDSSAADAARTAAGCGTAAALAAFPAVLCRRRLVLRRADAWRRAAPWN